MDAEWRKSTYSGSESPNCLECRADGSRVLIRDTQHRHLGHLSVPAREWRALLHALRREVL